MAHFEKLSFFVAEVIFKSSFSPIYRSVSQACGFLGFWSLFLTEDFIVLTSSFFFSKTCSIKNTRIASIKPFNVTGLFPHLLNRSENLWFSNTLRGIKREQ